VGRALLRLLRQKSSDFPFPVAGIHTRHATAIPPGRSGPPAASIDEFLDTARADIAVELTTLNPFTGEPATSHIRAAFARGMHVVTANKGPIAHAYAALRDHAREQRVHFRFESSVMDGAPVFNLVRNNLPGVKLQGFKGVLNSTSKIVVEAMEHGRSFEEGLAEARHLGIAEADASYDVEGWDSATKTAALANVLMDAAVSPQSVNTKGITRLTVERAQALKASGKTVRLVSRAHRSISGLSLRARAEVLDRSDILACVTGSSNLLLLHTDLMGTIGTVSISPTVDQTAYGLFSDLVDIARGTLR